MIMPFSSVTIIFVSRFGSELGLFRLTMTSISVQELPNSTMIGTQSSD